jgi:hypothetical protein
MTEWSSSNSFTVPYGLVKPLGSYMAKAKGSFGLDVILGPVERLIYRMFGIRPEDEMSWKTYAGAAILFKLAFFLVLYLMLRMQGMLPLNPQGFSGVSPDLAFNTAAVSLQHQLAVLRRRIDHELSDSDDGPQRPEFRLCCSGNGSAHCAYQGLYEEDHKDDR